MAIKIDTERAEVEKRFIGLHPNTSSVKPVHIANGLFRAILKKTFDTQLLYHFVFSQKADGKVEPGHELNVIYDNLINTQKIDEEISPETLSRLRVLMKKIVGADNAIFTGSMQSYSAGSEYFISKDTIAGDGGDLIATWLQRRVPVLHTLIENTLQESNDTITQICAPLLDKSWKPYPDPTKEHSFDYDNLRFLTLQSERPIQKHWDGLVEAATTLTQHLLQHPNTLLQLRLTVLFSCFVIIRHLSWLEALYVPSAEHSLQPILLDFSSSRTTPTAQASEVSYTHVCQSIARFYAWAFGEQLRSQYSLEDLKTEKTPEYKNNRKAKVEADEVWRIANLDANESPEMERYIIYGQALYDILALQAENPVSYLRNLGERVGLLAPPSNFYTTKQFSLQQDMLETLIRGTVKPGEVLDMQTLQDRLWQCYGIVVGGRPEDEKILLDAGIYQADNDALQENSRSFAVRLGTLGFASLLADGVLQIEVGDSHVVR